MELLRGQRGRGRGSEKASSPASGSATASAAASAGGGRGRGRVGVLLRGRRGEQRGQAQRGGGRRRRRPDARRRVGVPCVHPRQPDDEARLPGLHSREAGQPSGQGASAGGEGGGGEGRRRRGGGGAAQSRRAKGEARVVCGIVRRWTGRRFKLPFNIMYGYITNLMMKSSLKRGLPTLIRSHW